MAMSHAADCLPTSRKVEDISPFLANFGVKFRSVARGKEGMSNAQLFPATCLAPLQVPGNAARVFVRCICQASRSTEAPPGTGYTGFDEGPRGK